MNVMVCVKCPASLLSLVRPYNSPVLDHGSLLSVDVSPELRGVPTSCVDRFPFVSLPPVQCDVHSLQSLIIATLIIIVVVLNVLKSKKIH